MPDLNALDLSAIDPPVWRILVEDVVYGPYTLGQMRSFAEEGRLLEHSTVAHSDGGAFKPAFGHDELRPFFRAAPSPPKDEQEVEPANYLLTVQTDGDGRKAVIALLNEIGRFSELMPSCFIVRAAISVVDLRSQLATILSERGRCVIVNAETGQLAWMGLGADADAHAKIVWKRET